MFTEKKRKYITFQLEGDSIFDQTAIVFRCHAEHLAMANRLGLDEEDIIGAGFVYVDPGGCKPFGKSISLNVQSQEDDELVLNMTLGIEKEAEGEQ